MNQVVFLFLATYLTQDVAPFFQDRQNSQLIVWLDKFCTTIFQEQLQPQRLKGFLADCATQGNVLLNRPALPSETWPISECYLNYEICISAEEVRNHTECSAMQTNPTFDLGALASNCLTSPGSEASKCNCVLLEADKFKWNYRRGKEHTTSEHNLYKYFPVTNPVLHRFDTVDHDNFTVYVTAAIDLRRHKQPQERAAWSHSRLRIAQFSFPIVLQPNEDIQMLSDYDYTTIKDREQKLLLDVWLTCAPGFYGCDCMKHCVSDQTSTCQLDGRRECNENWYRKDPLNETMPCDQYCKSQPSKNLPYATCSENGQPACGHKYTYPSPGKPMLGEISYVCLYAHCGFHDTCDPDTTKGCRKYTTNNNTYEFNYETRGFYYCPCKDGYSRVPGNGTFCNKD